MKPVSTLFIVFLLMTASATNAQGIYKLWGMTKDGGDDNTGLMFNATGTGNNYQEKYQFNITNPGAYPQLTNLVEYNSKLYGMTQQGGSYNSGIIFEWDPATNTYTRKHAFNGYEGSGPLGSLVQYGGKFYGMTETGGGQSQGAIFEWNPATNIYTKEFDFIDNSIDGYYGYAPAGNLTMSGGKFYGMTTRGGNNDKGVIFEWDPATNIYTKKIEFNGSNGSQPFGNLILNGGIFYGMTSQGGTNDDGVIFQWDPGSNIYTKKVEFNGTNGCNPYGNLTLKGSVFIGMAQHGGINNDGVIFEWDPVSNTFTKKYDFNDDDGYWPGGDLSLKDGKYYSTAFRGGINDAGVIFQWDPALDLYTKMSDLGTATGKYPQAGLTLSNGIFYGMTDQGGDYNKGVIFQWDPSSNIYTKKIDLNIIGKGINPTGSVRLAGGKLYGMTNLGGTNNVGVIFEWDQAANTYTKMIDLDNTNGSKPTGSLTYNAGKFYGMTNSGGGNGVGVIFEWDQAANTYTKKIDLAFANGCSPQGSLVPNGGKLYGMTNSGGSNSRGVIFEWDPATNIYIDKIDLTAAGGCNPYGDLAAYNGKFYGMTNKGGTNSLGVIFEWDPATNTFVKKIDLSTANGISPYGSLTLFAGKFYGMTYSGGSNSKGVIFQWDPATNTYTKKFDFAGTDTYNPLGNLTLNGGKFYGMTRSGGANNGGEVFEWDPGSNIYTKKYDLNAYSGGSLPGTITDVSLAPAPVANGLPGSCTSFPSVTIDNTNNNVWVPIIDNLGNAVAEIKANGNNLGVVNTSAYINNTTVREDGSKRLYLDRNITITPQFQPASAIDIRLYIKNTEYLALKNAVNSIGQPSGISTISDVGIYKNNDLCSSSVGFIANPVVTTPGNWDNDYVLAATIGSLSTFYFANIAQGGPLPIANLEFNGRLVKDDGEINWKTTDEINTRSFDLERSADGKNYKAITTVAAINQNGIHQYNYIDKNINILGVPVVYYRLKQTDLDDHFKYSGIVALDIKSSNLVMLYPNPVINKANLTISINKAEQVQGRIIDNAGRIVKQLQLSLQAGSTSLSVDVSNLPAGIYYLELKGETINEHKVFSKQ